MACHRFLINFVSQNLLALFPSLHYTYKAVQLRFVLRNSLAFVYYKSANSSTTMFNNDFTGYEMTHDCMASIPMHSPFKLKCMHPLYTHIHTYT